MSIIETLQRPRGDTNSSDIIHVRCTAARKTWANESGSDRTGFEPQARAIEDWASEILRSSSYHPVRRVSCEVRDRVLILRGRVPSFYMKQLAQTVVRDLLNAGLLIDNRVEVD